VSATLAVAALAAGSFAASLWLTGLARRYALRAQMIDLANERASHSAPTPRGGGVAIVAAAAAGFAGAWAVGAIDVRIAAGIVLGGLPVAGIGWIDDHGHIRASARLVAHFAGAALAIWLIGAFPLAETVPFWSAGWAAAGIAVTALFLVWLVNLFNFMDGIDGIAGGEAVAVCLCGAVLPVVAGVGSVEAAAPPLLLAAAVLGFLRWNWPPARIFMGDVSSGFLGLALGALALAAGQLAPELAAAWVALLGVFIADATVTLGHRLMRGERVYEAHRSHAYQRLARRRGSHAPVTLLAIALTLFFCFPVACLIAAAIIQPLSGVMLVLLPLGAGAIALGAGSAED
jgi:Fuc2NAc and GlcNAc transferase